MIGLGQRPIMFILFSECGSTPWKKFPKLLVLAIFFLERGGGVVDCATRILTLMFIVIVLVLE